MYLHFLSLILAIIFATVHQVAPVFGEAPDLREYRKDGGLKLNLHAGQIEAYYSEARFIAIISGTQGGKTSFAPHWLLKEIATRGNGDYLYVTPSFTLLDKKALPEFLEVFERRGKLGRFMKGAMKFVFSEQGMRFIHGKDNYDAEKPTTVFFGHAKNPESLESATALAAVLDEAGQNDFKFDSWEAILRRVALNRGRILICTTPYNLGWLKKEVHDRWKAGDPNYHVVNFASTMNPRFPREEMEMARKRMPYWKFAMFYLGKFTAPAGLIYDLFESDPSLSRDQVNVIDDHPIPDHYPRVIGIDLGGINTGAVKIALDPVRQEWIVYGEYYPQIYRTANQHGCEIMVGMPTVTVDRSENKVTYDQEHITIVAGSLSEKQWRIEFQTGGISALPTFLRDVELGIDRVYGEIGGPVKDGDKIVSFQPKRLKVFRSCKRLLDEFGTYTREINNETGEAIPGTIVDKEKYHLLDALRYAISYIADPSRSRGWTQGDIEKLNPDGDLEREFQPLDDDSDEDDPNVKRQIARERARSLGKMDRRRFGLE